MTHQQRIAVLETACWRGLELIGELFDRVGGGATDLDRQRYEELCMALEVPGDRPAPRPKPTDGSGVTGRVASTGQRIGRRWMA